MVSKDDLNIKVGEYEVVCVKEDEGRFVWERNYTLNLRKGHREDFLMFLKVFRGYEYYKPWVEMFSINPNPLDIRYFGSEIELRILQRIYSLLPEGGRIYVEYFEDRESFDVLKRDRKPEESRIGKLLSMIGFRNLRNWYYPEGLREGGQKISGEKIL